MAASKTVTTTLPNGAIDRKTYDAKGMLTFEQIDFLDGTREQKTFQIKGAAYVTSDCLFDAQFRLVSQVLLRANGTIFDQLTRSYGTDGSVTTIHLDAKGAPLTKEVVKTDGTHIQTTYQITGMPYAAQELTFDPKWHVTNKVFYNADGSVYASQALTYAANGDIDTKFYDGTGALSYEQIDKADGTHVKIMSMDTGLRGPKLVRTEIYDKKWVETKQIIADTSGNIICSTTWTQDASGTKITTNYDANGNVTMIDKLFADKHHEITTFGLTGLSYNSEVQVYDANWHLTAQRFYDAKGLLLETDSFTYNSAGAMTFEQQDYANGTHIQTAHQITGKAYTDSVMTFDAKWRMTDMILYAADQSIYAAMHGVYNADGSSDLRYYDAKGQITLEKIDNANGTHVEKGVSYTGGFKSYEYDFDKNWKLTQLVQNNNDGTNLVKGFVDGQTLNSTGLGNDIMIGGGKNETFALRSNCGVETINDFIASGTGHDILAISKSMVADWTHLLADMHQMGSDLQITFDNNNSVTLKNVTASQLTQADVAFV